MLEGRSCTDVSGTTTPSSWSPIDSAVRRATASARSTSQRMTAFSALPRKVSRRSLTCIRTIGSMCRASSGCWAPLPVQNSKQNEVPRGACLPA
jgi:hypothetical protein